MTPSIGRRFHSRCTFKGYSSHTIIPICQQINSFYLFFFCLFVFAINCWSLVNIVWSWSILSKSQILSTPTVLSLWTAYLMYKNEYSVIIYSLSYRSNPCMIDLDSNTHALLFLNDNDSSVTIKHLTKSQRTFRSAFRSRRQLSCLGMKHLHKQS